MGYTIGFGAYGSAFTFNSSKLKRSNGTLEYHKYLKTICRIPNVDKVYLYSRSDYLSASHSDIKDVDPHGKIEIIYTKDFVSPASGMNELLKIDCQINGDEFNALAEKSEYGSTACLQEKFTHHIADYMKGKHVDLNIFYLSQGVSNWNVPNSKLTRHGKGNQSLTMTLNYVAPITQYLNKNQDVPYYILLPDPRWAGSTKWGILVDTFKASTEILSQFETTTEWRHVTKYDCTKLTTEHEYQYDKIHIKYREIEKVTSINEPIIEPDTERKTIFALTAMQATPSDKWEKDYRYKELKKWIIDVDPDGDYHIYGKWDPAVLKKHKHFKGMLSNEKVDALFEETKYTLIVPIAKDWVTAKYAEMLRVGVLPLFHPDYDAQCHVLPKDHILRMTQPSDVKKIIDLFEKYPDERIKLVKELQYSLLRSCKNGSFVTKQLNTVNSENGIDIVLETPKFKKKKNKMMSLFE
mgnify:FL=1|tara:strand:+ start:2206 stop:3603 length:1398 start_codon:yes stop_codon:yes gene_type:complete